MKRTFLITLALGSAWLAASATAWASPEPSFLKITSSDHPVTWSAGALQDGKSLRWDSSSQMLMADVKYSTVFYADSVNPSESNTYSLAFPNVSLAPNGRDLIATNKRGESVIIGHREGTLLGQRIVLNHGVDFNVHRVAGRIHASLTYNAMLADSASR